jgi:RNA polymerase sigma factor for flagellar operon FliA
VSTDPSELAARHLDLAHRAAALYHPRVRAHIEKEELVAIASVALTEAAHRFDPSGGATFRTYAWYRVQGSILDGLRRASNLPRGVWAQLTVLRATAEYLEAQAQRGDVARSSAPAAATADKLGEVRAALGAIRTMYVVALEHAPSEALTAEASQPDVQLARARQRARLAAALAALPAREAELLQKHYVEGKTLLDAGAELGLSKSWASRLHARAIDQLRAVLVADDTG